MLYPEEVITSELMWEYDYTEQQAKTLIESYKSQGKYNDLCDLINYRMSLKSSKDNLLHRYQG